MKSPKLPSLANGVPMLLAALALAFPPILTRPMAAALQFHDLRVEVAATVIVSDGSPEPPDGAGLVRLSDGSLWLHGEKASLVSTDRGLTWRKKYAPFSGFILEHRDGSLSVLAQKTAVSGRPGIFLGKRLSLGGLGEMASGRPLPWEETSVAAPKAVPMTGDDGKTAVAGPFIHGPFLELENGAWLVAAYGNFEGDNIPMEGFVATKGERWFKYRTYLLASTDRGGSWHYFSTVAYDGRTGQESFCEPALVNFGGGELLAVMRTGRFAPLYQARSRDGGKTWGKPEELPTLGLEPQLALLENGILVCSFGWRPLKRVASTPDGGSYVVAAADYQKRFRREVGIEDPSATAGDYVMFSLDRGRTWSRPRLIAPPLTSGYTRLAPTGPDSCLVLSRRIVIPGETEADVAKKWESEWTKWSARSTIVVEARRITVRR